MMDDFKEVVAELKPISEEYNRTISKPIIKYMLSLKNKRDVSEFVKITMRHSNLKVFIRNTSVLIDLKKDQLDDLLNQVIKLENYNSFYKLLGEEPSDEIKPILQAFNGQVVTILTKSGVNKINSNKYKRRIYRFFIDSGVDRL